VATTDLIKIRLEREHKMRLESEEKLNRFEKETEEELERVSHAKATISVELIAAKERIASLESQPQNQNTPSSSLDSLQQKLSEVTQERDALLHTAAIPSVASHDQCLARLHEMETHLETARGAEETLIARYGILERNRRRLLPLYRVATAEFRSKELQNELLAATGTLAERDRQLTAVQQKLDRLAQENADLLQQQTQLQSTPVVAEDVLCAQVPLSFFSLSLAADNKFLSDSGDCC
jgi:hypothetical protein